jgi:hypothetical protein
MSISNKSKSFFRTKQIEIKNIFHDMLLLSAHFAILLWHTLNSFFLTSINNETNAKTEIMDCMGINRWTRIF